MEKFSHTDEKGRAKMVDISNKSVQLRTAKAQGHIRLDKNTIKLINENQIKKGDVFTIAEIAGIQGAKKTSELIPLCHPLNITKIDVKASADQTGVVINSEVTCIGQTGIEMEAITAVSIALITIYDMCKAVDKNMIIDDVRLIEKVKTDVLI
jgi:cyclic pyranopterin monophosphate synthase